MGKIKEGKQAKRIRSGAIVMLKQGAYFHLVIKITPKIKFFHLFVDKSENEFVRRLILY